MNFESYGPFQFDRCMPDGWHVQFWNGVENSEAGLSAAIGCYAFCITSHRGTTLPWYIGKTMNQNGFKNEVFASQKLNHYKQAMANTPRGTPQVMLFPLMTNNWGFSSGRKAGKACIDWLETTLIGMAITKNHDLINTSQTSFHRNVYVNGLIGEQYPGRPHQAAAFARSVFC